METKVEKCRDCGLCRLDLKRMVPIGTHFDEASETMITDYTERVYCAHDVKLVGPDWDACYFAKHRHDEDNQPQ